MRHVGQIENLHANLPTIAVDQERQRWESLEAVPVPGQASITALPGHVVGAGGKHIALSPDAVLAAIDEYRLVNQGGMNRIYALPGVTVDGQPAVMRMAKDRGHVVGEVSEAIVSGMLVDDYRQAAVADGVGGDQARFSPVQVAGVVNVPTALSPGNAMESQRTQEERAAILMPLVHGQSLQQRMEQGTPLSSAQVGEMLEGFDRWISVAAKKGYVHTDIKPANILVGEDGTLVPIDHTIASASRLVGIKNGEPGPHLKASSHWWNGSAVNQALDRFETYGDKQQLMGDLEKAQRATVARMALGAALGQEPIPIEAYDGLYPYCAALNCADAYEPALALAKRQGIAPEIVDRMRHDLQEGLVGKDGLPPHRDKFKQ